MSSDKMNRGRRSSINRHVQWAHVHGSSSLAKRDINNSSYPEYKSRSDFGQQPRRYYLGNTTQQHILVVGVNSIGTDNSYSFGNRTPTPLVRTDASLMSETTEQQRRPWFIWIISIIEICVFIGELIYNWVLIGRPIETDLSKNPLFGPNAFLLINMGASFSPCMHAIDGITNNVGSTKFPCPSSSPLGGTGCTLSELCGLGGVSSTPNQWYRFIIPIFLHVGIVHIALNLIGQLLIAAEVEKKIGAIRIAIIYFASGIFGFILGSNFAPNGLARVGCSGSLFGTIAISLLNLLYHWKKIANPKIQLIVHLIDIIMSFALGLLPGVDNFSHVGGFIMGLLFGLAILSSPTNFGRALKPKRSKRAKNEWNNLRSYEKFFRNRPRGWWMWWLKVFTQEEYNVPGANISVVYLSMDGVMWACLIPIVVLDLRLRSTYISLVRIISIKSGMNYQIFTNNLRKIFAKFNNGTLPMDYQWQSFIKILHFYEYSSA
ncbi:unnamed protein product [Rotaria socialis]